MIRLALIGVRRLLVWDLNNLSRGQVRGRGYADLSVNKALDRHQIALQQSRVSFDQITFN
jgi:hypothetical protein